MDTDPGSDFVARRVRREAMLTIAAAPEAVHALICPVREAEWLDGWDHRMIYSESGRVEQGCVFTSRSASEPLTLWVVAVRDDARRMTRFVRLTPGSRVAVVDIQVGDGESPGSARLMVAYTVTALSEDGNRFVAAFRRQAFEEDMRFWEATMNHYLKTGRPLSRDDRGHWLDYTGGRR